jgi:DNA-binding transcriptional MerR regulator
MNFETNIPKKDSYKFNEVTSLTSVKPYVLRFWETEFQDISPEILEDGSKLYRESDIETIEKVKDLLFNQKMSIPEAKLILDRESGDVVSDFNPVKIETEEKTESNLNLQSADLKLALEKIIDSHSIETKVETKVETTQPAQIHDKAQSVAKTLVQDLVQTSRETSLSDKDIVNLITAKKKLTSILGRIDEISHKNNW